MCSRRASISLLVLLAACSTRRPVTADAAPSAPAIEVRGARGDLQLALLPRAVGWALRLPNQPQLLVRASDQGAQVIDREERSTLLRPGPAGMTLDLPDGRRYRVTQGGARLTVVDTQGIIQLAVDGTTARDGGSRIVHTVEPGGDRLLVLGADGERLGTVHNLPAGPAATVLAASSLDPRARAAIAAYLLSLAPSP